MQINAERISHDLDHIAAITETPGAGSSRPTFTPQWVRARDYVIEQATRAGCKHRIDSAGNVHIRPTALPWESRAWLSGSHIDSVPNGGKFDGVTGIVVPLEVLRAAYEAGITLPLELIIFAEEEGTTFNLGMLGSRAWCGTLNVERLTSVRNRDGKNYLEAGANFGVDPSKFSADRINPAHYCGLIEVHVEQGPAMWEQNIPVAVVTAINGRRQYVCTLRGTANHAGSTPMNYRKDALAAAAMVMLSLESCAIAMHRQQPGTVITIGRLNVEPNAINVIPGCVKFSIDLRASTDEMIAKCDALVRQNIKGICDQRGLTCEIVQTESLPAMPMNQSVCTAIRAAARRLAVGEIAQTTSGALHDAAIVAPFVPTAMLFVASRDGISHNPDEFSRIEDITTAARILAEVVRQPLVAKTLKLSQLNHSDRSEFVKLLGGVFEHSPWIAFGAWPKRPFSSIQNLHERMCDIVTTAEEEAKLSLINAHPDLVGKLAQAGELTAESTREQSAAGLSQLSPAEVEAFEKYNAEYRGKFGFPFVICARDNKKEAILAAFPQRLMNTAQQEMTTALTEIYKIAWLRLCDLVEGDLVKDEA